MFSLVSLSLFVVSAPLPAPDAPKGPPPRIEVVQMEKDGRPVLIRNVTTYQQVQKEITVNVGGRVEKRVVTEAVPVTVQTVVALDDKAVQVFGADGKRVVPGEVRKRLNRPTAVFVSSDDKPIDPFFLKLLRDGSYCVVAPEWNRAPKVESIAAPLPPQPKPKP